MSNWLTDLKISVRLLAKTPGFTASAVTVLALGIGLNAAMFGILYAFAWMGPSFQEPDRVVQLYSSRASEIDSFREFSFPAYREIAGGNDVFAGVLAQNRTIVGIGEEGESRRAFSEIVSSNYFDVLGVPITHGRGFTGDEGRPGQDIPVVVATYGYWKRTGFDPNILGRIVRVNERPFTVIGITPRGFTGTITGFGPEFFFPLGVFHSISNDFQGESARTLDRADAFNLFLVARLKKDVNPVQAAAALAAMGPGLERAFPAEYKDTRLTLGPVPRFGASAAPRNESVLGVVSVVMLGLTGAVLLVVCLNLASIQLARGTARRKEFAVRLALGSGRGRIVRQLLTEGMLLAVAGGACGFALASWGITTLTGAFSRLLPISLALEGVVSTVMAVATVGFCVLATAGFALGPALRHSRTGVLVDLKRHAGEDAVRLRRRFLPGSPLVVAQVALSLSLLIAAGLFVRMAQLATAVDFGYRADSTVLAEVDGTLANFTTPRTLDTFARLERRLTGLPGVTAASVAAMVPLGAVDRNQAVRRAGVAPARGGAPQTAAEGRAFSVPWNSVSGPYFSTMGVAVLRGRTFTDVESFSAGAPPVAIIDDVLARKLWPEGDALGKQVEWAPGENDKSAPVAMEVVGIVGATHRQLFEREMPGSVYVPFAQGALGNAHFHVRPSAPSTTLVDDVRREIRAEAPSLPLFGVRTFESQIRSSAEYWSLRMASSLFAVFGGLAMLVAAVGIYGVMSYTVVRRTREIGVRLAVGAMPRTVGRMILRESLAITVTGVGIGLLLGAGVGRLMATVFVDVAAFDPVVFVVVPGALLLAGVLAAWLPARRATRVSPMTALRTE